MKSIDAHPHVKNHRTKDDRRSLESPTQIPVIDIKGKIIQKDRRHIPDRRISNIKVTEHDPDLIEELFKQGIFKKE